MTDDRMEIRKKNMKEMNDKKCYINTTHSHTRRDDRRFDH